MFHFHSNMCGPLIRVVTRRPLFGALFAHTLRGLLLVTCHMSIRMSTFLLVVTGGPLALVMVRGGPLVFFRALCCGPLVLLSTVSSPMWFDCALCCCHTGSVCTLVRVIHLLSSTLLYVFRLCMLSHEFRFYIDVSGSLMVHLHMLLCVVHLLIQYLWSTWRIATCVSDFGFNSCSKCFCILFFVPSCTDVSRLLVYARDIGSCSLCVCHQLVQLVLHISDLLVGFVQNVFAFYSLSHRAQLCLDGPGLLVYARTNSCSLCSCHQFVFRISDLIVVLQI